MAAAGSALRGTNAMKMSKKVFVERLNKRFGETSSDTPYPFQKEQLKALNWQKAKENIVDAVKQVVAVADEMHPRPSWEWLVEKIRVTGQDSKALLKLARNLPDMIKPDVDEVLEGHQFTRHFGVDDELQLNRIENEGKDKVTNIISEGEDGKAYVQYTRYLAKNVPKILEDHVSQICWAVQSDLVNETTRPPFRDRSLNNAGRKSLVEGVIANFNEPYNDDEYFSIDFTWSVRISGNGDGATARLTCEPVITSCGNYKKEEMERSQSGEITKRVVEEPLVIYFGRKKFIIDGFSPDQEGAELSEKLNQLDFENIGVTQF
jgi:hypothetical protein